MKIRWLLRASNSLEAIVDFVAQDNPSAADILAKKIRNATVSLKDFPEMGKPGRIAGTRELIVPSTPYIIPYRIREDEVQILHVVHASRKWEGGWPS